MPVRSRPSVPKRDVYKTSRFFYSENVSFHILEVKRHGLFEYLCSVLKPLKNKVMKKYMYIFSLAVLAFIAITSCTKTKKCACTAGGIYEVIDSTLLARNGFPVQNVVFDTLWAQECHTLNYTDTTDIFYPENGVVMNEFLICVEK